MFIFIDKFQKSIPHSPQKSPSDVTLSAEIQPGEIIIHHNSTLTSAILSLQDNKFFPKAPRKSRKKEEPSF